MRSDITLLLCFLLLVSVASCNKDKAVECDEVCNAHKLAKNGDKVGARKILESPKFEQDGMAQFQLALLYEDANVPSAKALTHYKKSADLGFPTGMAYYGIMVLKGMGVEKNPDLALEYFMKVLNSEKANEQDKQLVRQEILNYKKEMIDQLKDHQIVSDFKADLRASGNKFLKSSHSKTAVDALDKGIYEAIMKAVKKIQTLSDSDVMGLMYNVKVEAINFFQDSQFQAPFAKLTDADIGEYVETKKCFTTANPEQDCYHLQLFRGK